MFWRFFHMAKKDKKDKKKGAAAVVATLQRQQANALVAYLNYKKYHWLSYGPLFRDIHLMLDEQATLVYDTIDEFAERAIMVGGAPISAQYPQVPLAQLRAALSRHPPHARRAGDARVRHDRRVRRTRDHGRWRSAGRPGRLSPEREREALEGQALSRRDDRRGPRHARRGDRGDARGRRGRDRGRRHRNGRPLHAPRPGAPEEPLVPERDPAEEGRSHELT